MDVENSPMGGRNRAWKPISSTVSDDLYRLSRALQAFTDAGDLRNGAAAHARLVKLHDSVGSSFSLWNKLLNLYCRSSRPAHADKLFNAMPHRDVVSYNTMLSSRPRSNCDLLRAVNLYHKVLEENVKPNNITFSTLLTACSNVAAPYLLEQTHVHVVKFGLRSDGFVGSGLVNAYAKTRGLDEALRAFKEIAEPDSVSWNIMIDACARDNSKHHAVEVFTRMRCYGGGEFDCFTLTSVLKTCSEEEDLALGMQLHACALKAGSASEAPVGNALVTMYSRCDEGVDSAVQVFRRIAEPNIISWTATISGLAKNGMAEEAVGLYRGMLRLGVMENEFCFASVLPAFGILASLEHGRQVHARIIKSEFQSDVGVGNALIDLYFKCGSLEDARLAFERMRSHDLVSWTVMITGLGQHGKGREALRILRVMRSRGFKPDDVAFLAGLSACGHGGLVDEGLQIFHSMVDAHGIKPRKEHYACVIDLLGRAGRLREAERFILEMGLESDLLAWEALLGACGMHGERELGERSAVKIMELEPHRDGPYVLLANIYAERKMWEEKGKVRKRLDVSGLRKEAAHSSLSGLDS